MPTDEHVDDSKKPEHTRNAKEEEPFLTQEAVKKRKDKIKENRPKGYWKETASRIIGMVKSFASLIVMPYGMFCGIVVSALYFWHTHYELVTLGALMCAAFCITMCVSDLHTTTGGKPKLFLGVLGLIQISGGFLVGLNIYSDHTYYYYTMMDRRVYTNVLPSEPSSSHADAGRLYFSGDAKIDTEKSVGFKSGSTYCVAPIVSGHVSAPVSFWAVGLDCCTARAQFYCPFITNQWASAGAVIMDAPVTSLNTNKKMMFEHAAKQAASVYNLVSSEHPIFVQWDFNPDNIMMAYWESGLGLTTKILLIDAVICVVMAVIMQFYIVRLKKEQALEASENSHHAV